MFRSKNQLFVQLSFGLAAIAVGISAVLYAKLINFIQTKQFFFFHLHPYLTSLFTPLLFVGATFMVIKIAPKASGSGIPQVLEAIELSKTDKEIGSNPLVSIRTAMIKILSTGIGILGGASIGREGPTVQIASSLFNLAGQKTKHYISKLNFQAYLIAGGAAGIAAAFNTPLAGITFALEEMAEGMFKGFKRPVMFSILIAGITAQALIGNYFYFGQPHVLSPSLLIIPKAIFIGVICGLAGGVFARLLAQIDFKFFPKSWWLKALLAGVLCSLINLISKGNTAGSGYEIVRQFMENPEGQIPLVFGLEKFITTLLSYFSGMAGGIFSPCLSIGAGLGYTFSFLLHFSNIKACVLIGMVAFFSGVVQAPLTAVVIVMEMTDEHILILPFMIAAVISQTIGTFFIPKPLYRYLAFGNKETQEK